MSPEPVTVYTCVTHGYDRQVQPAVPAEGLRFVCFTDRPGRLDAPGWELRPLESPARLASGHDINRFHKFFPHRLFPDCRWSVYIDGNVRFAGDWRGLAARVEQAGAGLGAFLHPAGHDLVQEVEACRIHRFDRRDMERVAAQLALYASHGIDLAAPIPTNNLLVRDHAAPGLDLAMGLWWSQLFEWCKRDQISLTYALSRAGVRWLPLDGEGLPGALSADQVQVVWHRPPVARRLARRIRRALGLVERG